MGGNGFGCPTLLLPLSLSLHLLSYCYTPTWQPTLGDALTAGFLSSTTPDTTSVTPMSSLFLLFLKVSPPSLSPLPVQLYSLKGLIMDSKLYPAAKAHQKHGDVIRHLCTHRRDVMLKTGIRAQWVWKYLILVKSGMQKCKKSEYVSKGKWSEGVRRVEATLMPFSTTFPTLPLMTIQCKINQCCFG